MSLTTEQKNFLNTNKQKIIVAFNRDTGAKRYIGLYMTANNTLFMTYNVNTSFANPMMMGRMTMAFVCFFDKLDNFDIQFDAFVL